MKLLPSLTFVILLGVKAQNNLTCFLDSDCANANTCTTASCVNGFCNVTLLGEPGHGYCGDKICQDGENCENCPIDCRGRAFGKIKNQYCCFGGPRNAAPVFVDTALYGPIATTCETPICARRTRQCDTRSVLIRTSAYCGDGICQKGENCENCPTDCVGRSHGRDKWHFCCYGGSSTPTFQNPALTNMAIPCNERRCRQGDRKCDLSDDDTLTQSCGTFCLTADDCFDGDACTEDICHEGYCLHVSITVTQLGYCGDGICQEDENCENCFEDCRRRLFGDPSTHMCCYGGVTFPSFLRPNRYANVAISCADQRCQRRGFGCDASPANATVMNCM